MKWWHGSLVVMVIVASGCTPVDDDGAVPQVTPTEATSTTVAATTIPGAADGDACQTGDLSFRGDGLIAALGGIESDATGISDIRWEPSDSCERLVISFAAGSGAPATTLGITAVTAVPSAGFVRVSLADEVSTTSVADMRVDGSLIDRVYVVRGSDGSMFVDVIGSADASLAVRAFVSGPPSSIVIDVIDVPDRPSHSGVAVSDAAVVFSPLPGPALYPVTIDAYAQPSLRSVRVQMTNGTTMTVDRALGIEGRSDAWQAVSTRIDGGPPGPATIFVGTVDPNGRPLVGATVAIDLP
ncbi:MAG TPA: hypothetical protein VLA29_11275 [Acidimicrobiia bacterium]|nr:hypothetical protein [Acidimicrobiia bacterium]